MNGSNINNANETTLKTIRINFCGFWSSFDKEKNLFTLMLEKHFNVEISDKPDFIICSNRGTPFEYMKYDCVRIMFMGENLSPDFSVFDYCIGFDFLEFGDRYFRLPFAFYFDNAKPWIPEQITREDAINILKEKEYFCNFIYGHKSSHGMREKLFSALNEYKRVISPGSYLNNLDGGNKRCSWQEKHRYLEKSKFTIAVDSIHYPGFVTEKIVDSFRYHSIPVYFGSTSIYDDFNRDAFVCCKNEEDIERVVQQVMLIDSNDELYLDMLMQLPLHSNEYLVKRYEELETFLVNIFSQSVDVAFRRVRFYCAETHESYLKDYMKSRQKKQFFWKYQKHS